MNLEHRFEKYNSMLALRDNFTTYSPKLEHAVSESRAYSLQYRRCLFIESLLKVPVNEGLTVTKD